MHTAAAGSAKVMGDTAALISVSPTIFSMNAIILRARKALAAPPTTEPISATTENLSAN